MDLAVTSSSLVLDDNSWLGSEKGTDTTETITIDPSKGFVAATHYPDGFIKSGIPLGKVTASGFYGLYDDTATDGRQTCVGFLYGGVKVNTANPTTVKLGAALLWEGRVKLARLPIALDAAGQADLATRFRLV